MHYIVDFCSLGVCLRRWLMSDKLCHARRRIWSEFHNVVVSFRWLLCRLEGPNFWFQHVLQIKQAGGFIEDFNTVVSYGSQVIGECLYQCRVCFVPVRLRSRSLIKELFLCFAKTLWNIRRYSNVLASSGCALDEEIPFCCTDDPSLFHFSRLNLSLIESIVELSNGVTSDERNHFVYLAISILDFVLCISHQVCDVSLYGLIYRKKNQLERSSECDPIACNCRRLNFKFIWSQASRSQLVVIICWPVASTSPCLWRRNIRRI